MVQMSFKGPPKIDVPFGRLFVPGRPGDILCLLGCILYQLCLYLTNLMIII